MLSWSWLKICEDWKPSTMTDPDDMGSAVVGTGESVIFTFKVEPGLRTSTRGQ